MTPQPRIVPQAPQPAQQPRPARGILKPGIAEIKRAIAGEEDPADVARKLVELAAQAEQLQVGQDDPAVAEKVRAFVTGLKVAPHKVLEANFTTTREEYRNKVADLLAAHYTDGVKQEETTS